MRPSSTLSRPATRTHSSRLLWADLVRAGALLVVVLGHYLMAVVQLSGDDVTISTLLDLTTWSHPLTWLLQVMGCFFAVGAVVSAPRLAERMARAAEVPGGRARVWRDHVASRTRTLLVPTLPLLAVWWTAGPILRGRFPDGLVSRASQAALVPLWFLAVYLLVHALLPLMVRVVVRHGAWRPVAILLAGAGLVDLAHLAGVPIIGYLNFGLVWMAPTTVGVGMGLGVVRPRGLVRAVAVALSLAIAAIVIAGYTIPLVGTAAAGRPNNFPPTVLLGLHAVAHSGVVLLLAPRLEGWLGASARRRSALAAAGTWSMPIYLWHMTGFVLLAVGALIWTVPVVGDTFALIPLTPEWWLARPLQMAAGLMVTGGLIAVVARPTTWLVRRSLRVAEPGTGGTLVGAVAGATAIATVVLSGTAEISPVAILSLVVALGALHPGLAQTGSDRVSK